MAKTLPTSAENRKCAYPGCTRTLSIYNHEPFCHVHRDRATKLAAIKAGLPVVHDPLATTI